MSSTDGGEDTKDIDAFWSDRIVPAARALRERGRTFFPAGFEEAPSWYEPYTTRPEQELESMGEVVQALEEIWKDDAELVALAGPLAALSEQVAPVAGESEDVSPFVYVMF
jgi:hypothetical protein